jgi:curved DNA-binding protein CbpA
MDDYYTVLELPTTADIAAIRTQYKRLARIRHPDKNPNDASATQKFQLVSFTIS